MKFAIFGTKKEAIYLKNQIETHYPHLHEVECFVDNSKLVAGSVIDGLFVLSVRQFKEMYGNSVVAVIVVARGLASRYEIIQQLRSEEIYKIGLYTLRSHDYGEKLVIDEDNNSSCIVWIDDDSNAIIPQIEIHMADECNLKCKGCSHFANLFTQESRYELKLYKRDLTVIANNCYVFQLHLLGGEPLLCDNLYEYIDFARSIFPNSRIMVFTNGLLLEGQPDKLFDSMTQNNAEFQITPYVPTWKIKDRIAEFLRKKNVRFSFEFDFGFRNTNQPVQKFIKPLGGTGDSDPEMSMSVCISGHCRFLRNGKLYKCPIEGMIYKYFETYGIPDSFERGIDIYNVSDWHKAAYDLYANPVDTCRYCAERAEAADWEVSAKPEKSDWIANCN